MPAEVPAEVPTDVPAEVPTEAPPQPPGNKRKRCPGQPNDSDHPIIMSAFNEEKVLSVHHWTDRLFSFTTTRGPSLRFLNGHITMLGLRVNNKPLLRAYSVVSPNYAEHLEFLSVKVADGPLTSRLQHIQIGDTVIVGNKPTGTLVIDYLLQIGRASCRERV